MTTAGKCPRPRLLLVVFGVLPPSTIIAIHAFRSLGPSKSIREEMQNTADLKGQLVLLQKKRKARSARRPLKLSQLLQEDITKRTSQSISWYTERLKNLSTAHEGLGSSEDETCEHDARPVLVKSRPFSYTKFDTLYDPFLRSGGLTQRQLHFNHLCKNACSPS